MAQFARYEMLQNEGDTLSVEGVSSDNESITSDNGTVLTPHIPQIRALPLVQPQIAEAAAAQVMANSNNQAPKEQDDTTEGIPSLPSYNIATQLPSYEEAERTKAEEAALSATNGNNAVPKSSSEAAPFGDMQLGTDGMFMCTFIVSFLFNWIGLLVSLCITNTVAGRFGALAGFGLSMVKWVVIFKHQNWADHVAATDSWLWWMLIILGFMIFFRGCMQYIRIKHQWNRLGSLSQDRAYMLF